MSITKEEANERLRGVLMAAGIKIEIGGCSCCGVYDVTFPDGEQYVDDSFYIECDGLSHQRG